MLKIKHYSHCQSPPFTNWLNLTVLKWHERCAFGYKHNCTPKFDAQLSNVVFFHSLNSSFCYFHQHYTMADQKSSSEASITSVISFVGEYSFAEPPSEIFHHNNTQYTRRRLIGKGAFAFCYLYQSRETNAQAVAKISSKTNLVNNQKVSRMQSLIDMWTVEQQIMRKLNHCNIVKFFAYAEVTYQPFFLFMATA